MKRLLEICEAEHVCAAIDVFHWFQLFRSHTLMMGWKQLSSQHKGICARYGLVWYDIVEIVDAHLFGSTCTLSYSDDVKRNKIVFLSAPLICYRL